jgi:hypothetical protein
MLTRTKKLASLATQLAKNYILPCKVVGMGRASGRFGFCKAKWNREEFNKKLEKEISDLEGGIQQGDPENEAYFKQHSWNIRYIPENRLF